MPASYTIRRSVPRNTRRSKPASTPSTCFPSFSINLFMAFPLPLVICLPTQQTSYGNRKRHHRLVAAMPRYDSILIGQVVVSTLEFTFSPEQKRRALEQALQGTTLS